MLLGHLEAHEHRRSGGRSSHDRALLAVNGQHDANSFIAMGANLGRDELVAYALRHLPDRAASSLSTQPNPTAIPR